MEPNQSPHSPPQPQKMKSERKPPLKVEAKYSFADKIYRVVLLLRDRNCMEHIFKDSNVRNILNTNVPLDFNSSFFDLQSKEHRKTLTWKFEDKKLKIVINIVFNLIANTMDDTTVLILTIEIENPDIIPLSIYQIIVNNCKYCCTKIINDIEDLLQESNKFIFEYQSILINAPIERVWDYLVYFKFLEVLDLVVNDTSKKYKEGDMIELIVSKCNKKINCKINKLLNDPNKNKWKFSFTPMICGTSTQKIEFVLLKIDEKNTFVSNCHMFERHIDKKIVENITNFKQKILLLLKNSTEKNKVDNENIKKLFQSMHDKYIEHLKDGDLDHLSVNSL